MRISNQLRQYSLNFAMVYTRSMASRTLTNELQQDLPPETGVENLTSEPTDSTVRDKGYDTDSEDDSSDDFHDCSEDYFEMDEQHNEHKSEDSTPELIARITNLPFELQLEIFEHAYEMKDTKVDLDPSLTRSERRALVLPLQICRNLRHHVLSSYTVVGHFYDYIGHDPRTGLVIDFRDPKGLRGESLRYEQATRMMGHSTMLTGSCLGSNSALRQLFLSFRKRHLQVHLMQPWDPVTKEGLATLSRIKAFSSGLAGLMHRASHGQGEKLTVAVDTCIDEAFYRNAARTAALQLWDEIEDNLSKDGKVKLEKVQNKILKFRGYRWISSREVALFKDEMAFKYLDGGGRASAWIRDSSEW